MPSSHGELQRKPGPRAEALQEAKLEFKELSVELKNTAIFCCLNLEPCFKLESKALVGELPR